MKRKYIIISGAILCGWALVAIFMYRAVQPRIIARATAPDGTEMCVVQEFNWSAEPFTTRFLYRHPGGSWGAFYFDHQDIYWGIGKIKLNSATSTAIVLRSGKKVIEFNWKNDVYVAYWPHLTRTMQGAQWLMASDWEPGLSLEDIASDGPAKHISDK
ncbi:hypothetical protein JXA32_16155 [Candidatus Sumerlaeota bacterium]|nr:hypothetical protein [Candidatus Sumerlaeota bacterium]